MNEYEQEREERIARNKEMLARLQVTQLVSRAEAVVSEQEKRESEARKRRAESFKLSGAVRRSARVKTMPVTTNYFDTDPAGDEVAVEGEASGEEENDNRIKTRGWDGGGQKGRITRQEEDDYMPSPSDREEEEEGAHEEEEGSDEDRSNLPRGKNDNASTSKSRDQDEYVDEEAALRHAVELSLQDGQGQRLSEVMDLSSTDYMDEDEQLQQALRLSLVAGSCCGAACSSADVATTVKKPGGRASSGTTSTKEVSRLPRASQEGPASAKAVNRNKKRAGGGRTGGRRVKAGPTPSCNDVAYAYGCLDRGNKGMISVGDIVNAAKDFGFDRWSYQQCADMIQLFSTGEAMSRSDFDELVEAEGCGLPS